MINECFGVGFNRTGYMVFDVALTISGVHDFGCPYDCPKSSTYGSENVTVVNAIHSEVRHTLPLKEELGPGVRRWSWGSTMRTEERGQCKTRKFIPGTK